MSHHGAPIGRTRMFRRLCVGRAERRQPRVDARVDEVEAYVLTLGRSRRGRNGLIASFLRSPSIAARRQRKIVLSKVICWKACLRTCRDRCASLRSSRWRACWVTWCVLGSGKKMTTWRADSALEMFASVEVRGATSVLGDGHWVTRRRYRPLQERSQLIYIDYRCRMRYSDRESRREFRRGAAGAGDLGRGAACVGNGARWGVTVDR
jgi:hypothetical protein